MVLHHIKLVAIPHNRSLLHRPCHIHSKASLRVEAGMVAAAAHTEGHLLATMDLLHNNTMCLRLHRKVVARMVTIILRRTRVDFINRMATLVGGLQVRVV